MDTDSLAFTIGLIIYVVAVGWPSLAYLLGWTSEGKATAKNEKMKEILAVIGIVTAALAAGVILTD